tara:strand:+ start:1675 stop:2628 length:954 start_codon:yes stop_codon:yes gene_type:complete
MYKFSVPSKTFLIGEYSVMQGGTGLLVGTHPRFEAFVEKVNPGEEATYEGFSQAGPAMSYLKDHINAFAEYSVRIHDPHYAKGGMGWSSAQFVILYALNQWIQNQGKDLVIDRKQILEDYLHYAWNGEGWAPSGLDVVCHLEGGLMQVTAPRKIVSNRIESVILEDYYHFNEWPLSDLDFCLIRTGKKVATHAHLSNLNAIELTKLSEISSQAAESLKQKNEEKFLSCIQEFRENLIEQSLVEPRTLQIFQHLHERPEVLTYKGCGALGADVILVIVISDLLQDFKDWVAQEDYEWLASSQDITKGLLVEEMKDEEE